MCPPKSSFSGAFVSPLPVSQSTLRSASLHVAATFSVPQKPSRSSPTTKAMVSEGDGTLSRRHFLHTALLGALAAAHFPPTGGGAVRPAGAINGLRVYPFREPLTNNYYLMRSGETRSDAVGVTAVNPVDKLSIEKLGLTARGVRDAEAAAEALLRIGISADTWLWPSVTISAFETAEIIAARMRIRRDRIVPEFSFLDARGVGAMEGRPVSEVRRATKENDRVDPDWRPTPGEDGTPNDSVNDVFVRINQLLSKLETQYFGQDIVVVAPDSDPLSVWQAAVTGRRLTEHTDMWYAPGEVRLVKEQVVDAYGKVTEEGTAKTVFKPV